MNGFSTVFYTLTRNCLGLVLMFNPRRKDGIEDDPILLGVKGIHHVCVE